jgi:hypothetical protein
MRAKDVIVTLDMALATSGHDQARVRQQAARYRIA